MLTKKKISVIPIAYKDEGNIQELYKRLTKVLTGVTSDYEIIYVNDASPDESQAILEKLAKKDKKLTVITHSRNFGAQSAFTTGMLQAVGDAVILMDGDLQDPPELIVDFVKKWLEGYEVVYGSRKKREKSMGKFWEFAYHSFYVLFNKLSYVKVPMDAGDFSLMDRRVVDCINDLPEKDRFIRGLRAWVGFKQIGISYVRPERFSGSGVATNSIWKGIFWVRKAIFSFSYAPLEWVFYTALFGVFVSLVAILFYVILYFLNPDTPRGFLTLLVAVLFIGSVQLVVLSIICEYLRRVFEEVKNRPYSIIESITNDHKKQKK
ncbi:glycosyltransferase family 2 protein [Patescibacteria group bacterium]|nr:glycosyltransferase family 2 protein [Patescibacteria group bacterium]